MRYTITPDLIRLAVPNHADPQAAAAALDEACARYGVTTRTAVAVLLAQLAHESNIMPLSENLWYSAPRIQAVWPSRFPTVHSADPYAENPEALANKVYDYRKDLGNVTRGDGWRFRGRGYVQITGREMYRAVGKVLGLDLEAQPDLALTHRASAFAALEVCRRKGLFSAMAAGNMYAVTKAINGSDRTHAARLPLFERLMRTMPVEQTVAPQPTRSTAVFLTHSDEAGTRTLWDGKPGGVYGGHALDEGFFARVRAMYRAAGTYRHGGVDITVAVDGALILDRI